MPTSKPLSRTRTLPRPGPGARALLPVLALLLALAASVTACFPHRDRSYGEPTDHDTSAQWAARLRQMAAEKERAARAHEWFAERGGGRGGLVDLSGVALRRATGMTRDELRREAREAREMAAAIQARLAAHEAPRAAELAQVNSSDPPDPTR